jgi:hypothetical protein
LRSLLEGFFSFWRGPRFTACACEDLPETVEGGVVYLIGDKLNPWSAAMLCPCGCGSLIQLSLLPNDRPRWRAHRHFDGAVSLFPSVWRNKGCFSHFILRNGRIQWAQPGPPPPLWGTDVYL